MNKIFCSNLMSFYPMELIFIGWIGDTEKFYWVLRNFEFYPTNGIFLQKDEFPTFQKVPFLGVWCRKLILSKIGVMDMFILWIRIKICYAQLSLTFFIIICRFIKKSKSFLQKKITIFWSKMCSRGAKSGSIGIQWTVKKTP